mgnify:CR=1 FL=1
METLELNDVTIRWISVSDMENNVYLITSKNTDKQVLIDAANDTAQIEKLVKEHGNGKIEAILTTHSHPDHIQSLADIARAFEARTLAGLYDVSEIEEQTGIEIDEQLANDDMLEFDGFRLRAVHLKGHTQVRSRTSCVTIQANSASSSAVTRSSQVGPEKPPTQKTSRN